MPTKREREYYAMGFSDGFVKGSGRMIFDPEELVPPISKPGGTYTPRKPKRKISAWNKFVKANSKKKEFRYRDGKLNLKKMGVAFRRKKRR